MRQTRICHVVRCSTSPTSDPALGAEHLHAPGLGGRDDRAEIARRAAPETEQHRSRVVDAVILRAAGSSARTTVSIVPGEIQHRIDDVHAAAGHAARRALLALLAPVVASETGRRSGRRNCPRRAAACRGGRRPACGGSPAARAGSASCSRRRASRRLWRRRAPRASRSAASRRERLLGEHVLAGASRRRRSAPRACVCGVASTTASIVGSASTVS